jgi:pimeloyl-ACP methyl ester carboxylesterase
MVNEHAFIERIETADPDEFAQILMHPSLDEERVLRAYFGDIRYERLHRLALQENVTRGQEKRGTVIVLHGIMGSELTAFDRHTRGTRIWVHLWHLALGHMRYLRLNDIGRAEYDDSRSISATGLIKRYYAEQLLYLSRNWRVRGFWYDWRKDLNLSAELLKMQMTSWFNDDEPVHLVAHSMGGLVARTFIKNYPDRWNTMWDVQGNGRRGGRLIMLGTPNYGSFTIPQVLTGLERDVKRLAKLDLRHNMDAMLEIIHSFPGIYQMLPSPDKASVEELYQAETYGGLNIPQHYLNNARNHHKVLKDVVYNERMIYVAGYDRLTLSGIKELNNKEKKAVFNPDLYEKTLAGDGQVPHALGFLNDVKNYFVDETHGSLQINRKVLTALDDLLETGYTERLENKIPGKRADTETRRQEAEQQALEKEQYDDYLVNSYLRRLKVSRGINVRNEVNAQLKEDDLEPIPIVLDEERELSDIATLGFLSASSEAVTQAPEKVNPASLEVALACGGIEQAHDPSELILPGRTKSTPAVTAISVGHYLNVKPQYAELALDKAISGDQAPYLLTDYTERGVIRGELGQPFILPDPRKEAKSSLPDRIIVVAGMGYPGRFNVPELAVLVRELAWSVNRLKLQHLCTVLIGSGEGNIAIEDAVDAWVRGLAQAFTGVPESQQLKRVTFVENNPHRIERLNAALLKVQDTYADRIKLEYEKWTEDDLKNLAKAKASWDSGIQNEEKDKKEGEKSDYNENVPPSRITIELDGETYRFGAITETAAIPEREIPLDPDLVDKVNNELIRLGQLDAQIEQGRFLEELLLPKDLRERLAGNAPLVLMLDATTARIHWEMLAQPAPTLTRLSLRSAVQLKQVDIEDYFLGTARGLTRQLRTTFAPPPEPPPPPQRVLRVLIVADPAEDARLAGAEEEGVEVAELFERFNGLHVRSQNGKSQNRVEVVSLIGPRSATRERVLKELLLGDYDVVHYAGHCVYDTNNPSASGWVFSNGKRLTARELNRIDRIPHFIFANACESGITPDRSEKATAGLAPGFAEAFFAQGVSNFVCTAWPVDDQAARIFALTLYARLLGLEIPADNADKEGNQTNRNSAGDALHSVANNYQRSSSGPGLMYKAMHHARLAAVKSLSGLRTWGAYQHYGNPYYRFFRLASEETIESSTPKETSEAKKTRASNAETSHGKPDKQNQKKESS